MRAIVEACSEECLRLLSPDKLRNPLGWPFGKLDPGVLDRLLQEQKKQRPKPAYEPAPF